MAPRLKEQIMRASDLKELTLSELARAYIVEGLRRDGLYAEENWKGSEFQL
jgi:hypothetical protein